MKFSIKNALETLFPITSSNYVLGKNNYSMTQTLDEFKKSIKNTYTYKKYIISCYEENQNTFDITECIENEVDYEIFVFLNGILLLDRYDYNIHKNNIIFTRQIKTNDFIVIKVITSNNSKTNSNNKFNLEEKLLINNIINRINTYSKTIKKGENIVE